MIGGCDSCQQSRGKKENKITSNDQASTLLIRFAKQWCLILISQQNRVIWKRQFRCIVGKSLEICFAFPSMVLQKIASITSKTSNKNTIWMNIYETNLSSSCWLAELPNSQNHSSTTRRSLQNKKITRFTPYKPSLETHHTILLLWRHGPVIYFSSRTICPEILYDGCFVLCCVLAVVCCARAVRGCSVAAPPLSAPWQARLGEPNRHFSARPATLGG